MTIDNRWLAVNPGLCALLGYQEHELLATPPLALLHADDAAATAALRQRLLAGDAAAGSLEARYRLRTGEYLQAHLTVSLVRAHGGEPLCYVDQVVGIDDERMREEQARKTSEARLQMVIGNAPVILLALDADGIFTLCEGSALAMIGVAPGELAGMPVDAVYRTRPDILAQARRALAGEDVSGEVVTNDSVFDMRWTPLRDDHGLLSGAICIATDITTQKLAEQVLIDREARYRALSENAHDLICILNADGYVQYESPSLARLLGKPLAEAQEDGLLAPVHPDDWAAVREALRALVEDGRETVRFEHRYLGADGAWHTVESVAVNRLDDPWIQGIIATSRDITERKALDAILAASEHRARILIEKAPVGASVIDENGFFEVMNPSFAEMYGYTPAEMLGRHFNMVMPESRRDDMTALMLAPLAEGSESIDEYMLQNKDGRQLFVSTTAVSITGADGRPRRALFMFDVTDQKQNEQRLQYAAQHDALTGLPNRVLFHDRLDHALRIAASDHKSLAVFLLDLNRFKAVNDGHGHAVGDTVLKVVAERLNSVVRATDTVARLGGDEFAVLLPNADEAGALRVAGKIRAAVTQPITLAHITVDVGASIGISLYPEQATDGSALLHCADVAMYAVKSAGGGALVYVPTVPASPARAPSLALDQRAAIANGELRLLYQPVADWRAKRTTRLEALVRWQHPSLGLLEPQRFIALAEGMGTIHGITLWVLQEALGRCRDWRAAGHDVGVSVNLSVQVLQDTQFTDLVGAMLRDHAMAPQVLTLEVSESALIYEPEQVIANLEKLAGLGVRIALGNVGAGVSSFAAISRLPLHELKIDRTVVAQTMEPHGAALLAGLLGLARALELAVVGEGVETQEIHESLRHLGCRSMQGYYISHPLAADEVEDWLRS